MTKKIGQFIPVEKYSGWKLIKIWSKSAFQTIDTNMGSWSWEMPKVWMRIRIKNPALSSRLLWNWKYLYQLQKLFITLAKNLTSNIWRPNLGMENYLQLHKEWYKQQIMDSISLNTTACFNVVLKSTGFYQTHKYLYQHTSQQKLGA